MEPVKAYAEYSSWEGMEVIDLYSEGYRLRVIPAMGGNPISLTYEGEDILNAPESLRRYREAQNNFGIPHLFPPNRIRGGRFEHGGREYQFPLKPSGNSLHGFLHDVAWEVEEEKAEDGRCLLSLVYKSDSEASYYGYFPHDFHCRRRYILDDEGLREEYEVINRGEDSLPLSVGFHTAFPVRKETTIRVNLKKRYILDEGKISTGERKELDLWETRVKSEGASPLEGPLDNLYSADRDGVNRAIIGNTHSRGDIVYETDRVYAYWILCNYDNRGDIVCIEPQTGIIDVHNRKDEGLIILEKGRSFKSINRIYIKKSS